MKRACLVFLLASLCYTLSYAEEIKLTTIIPNQTTLRTKQGAIGNNVSDPATLSDAQIPASGLVVQGNVIGAGWQNYKKLTWSCYWTAPAGVYKIMAWIVGGGGGGGTGGTADDVVCLYGSGGGGGGGCTDILIANVTPGASYFVNIGDRGVRAANDVAVGGAGGPTIFLGETAGGGGGGVSRGGCGGAGGIGTGSGLFFNGNPGENGTKVPQDGGLVGTIGGSGGSAGGLGATGVGQQGSDAPAGSGGGGGGGGGDGGSGAGGYVIIWY